MTSSKITYREMNHDDVEGVYEVENDCFSDPWSIHAIRDELKNRLSHYLVAEMDDEIVGYAGIWYILDEGHITNVAVKKAYRGMGIGNGLLEEVIRRCRENQINSMTLEVRKSNTVAQNLYKKYGFLPGGIRKEYYSDNKEDAIIMWKEMKGEQGIEYH